MKIDIGIDHFGLHFLTWKTIDHPPWKRYPTSNSGLILPFFFDRSCWALVPAVKIWKLNKIDNNLNFGDILSYYQKVYKYTWQDFGLCLFTLSRAHVTINVLFVLFQSWLENDRPNYLHTKKNPDNNCIGQWKDNEKLRTTVKLLKSGSLLSVMMYFTSNYVIYDSKQLLITKEWMILLGWEYHW